MYKTMSHFRGNRVRNSSEPNISSGGTGLHHFMFICITYIYLAFYCSVRWSYKVLLQIFISYSLCRRTVCWESRRITHITHVTLYSYESVMTQKCCWVMWKQEKHLDTWSFFRPRIVSMRFAGLKGLRCSSVPCCSLKRRNIQCQNVISFFQGTSLLTDSSRLHQGKEGTTYFLVVDNAAPEDGGVYTCVAKNTGGEVLCKAELVVHEGNVVLSAQELLPQPLKHVLGCNHLLVPTRYLLCVFV